MKKFGVVSIAVCSLLAVWMGLSHCPVQAQEKTAAQLETGYNQEPSFKKRVKLAIQLMDERLKLLRSAYEAEDSEKEAGVTENYLTAVDLLEKAVKEPSGSGASKDAEINLRRQTRILEDLRRSASSANRASLDKPAERVAKLHEEILYSIMNPQKNGKKR